MRRAQQSTAWKRLRTMTMAKAGASKHAEARYIINIKFCFMAHRTQGYKRWSINPAGKPRERG